MRNTVNIFSKEEKKVEYVELIYDLIFVYMIGRDNALLENVQNGFVSPLIFAIYISSTLSIIQIWNFTTFYINMFGRNGLREHIFLFVNMYLMYFVGEATRITGVSGYVGQYHVAWGLILVNIGLQYLLELRNHAADVWNQGLIRRMSSTLFIEAVIVFAAAFLEVRLSLWLSFAAVAAGVLLTAVSRSTSVGGQVDFMHLTERAMLYVVFTFGEMIIAIAGYFIGRGRFNLNTIYFSLMTFLLAVGLFLSYEVIYDYLVDREGEYNGMLYMLIHIFIIFAMNFITVSFEFLREEEIAVLPKVLMLTLSVVGYFVFLFLLGRYFKLQCRMDRGLIIRMILISAAFVIAMLLFRDEMSVNVLISVVYVLAVFLVLYRLKRFQDRVLEGGERFKT